MFELSLIAKIILAGSLIGGVAVYKSRTPDYKPIWDVEIQTPGITNEQ